MGDVCVCFVQVNLEYLEGKLESLDGDEVMKVKDNINSLFHHCVQALSEEHQIKVVNALQVKSMLINEGVQSFITHTHIYTIT